uniref:(California timema) hypothetical protein n=1 Tax=Timema californicum TaxID=61474 RepID=A0A7R9J9W9_TIMCA|nr:unnamed protein product [Timema californicum]
MLSVFDTCGIVLPKAIPTSPGRVSPWKIRLPQCHFDLAKFPKATTPNFVYERTFNELLSTRFHGFERIYTDGSKSGASVGCAFVEEADLVEDVNNQVQFYDPCSGIMRSIPNVFTSKDKSKVIDDARKKIVLNILWQVDSVQLMEEEASNVK